VSDEQIQSSTRSQGYGIAAFICGLVSLFIPFFGFVLGIAAIILFFIQIKKGGSTGLAIAGLILGIISTLLLIITIIFTVAFFGNLDQSNFLPDKCIFGSGIGGCSDISYNNETLQFILTNNFGRQITIESVNAISEKCPNAIVRFGEANWNSNEAKTFSITGCSVEKKERLTTMIEFKVITNPLSPTSRTVLGEVAITQQ